MTRWWRFPLVTRKARDREVEAACSRAERILSEERKKHRDEMSALNRITERLFSLYAAKETDRLEFSVTVRVSAEVFRVLTPGDDFAWRMICDQLIRRLQHEVSVTDLFRAANSAKLLWPRTDDPELTPWTRERKGS